LVQLSCSCEEYFELLRDGRTIERNTYGMKFGMGIMLLVEMKL
jgi:hypothetical protein